MRRWHRPRRPPEIRKTVTIVFSDLRGSTDLGERLDAESLRELIGRYFDAMRAELEAHGGTIEKYIGDAIMAVFGLPTVHEDDAMRAVRAALSMREALLQLNDQLERTWGVRLANRTGIHTGEVVAGDPSSGQRLVTGDPVNTAARLEQAAPVDGILLGELTYRLVRDAVEATELEPLELKGKAERVRAWELAGLRAAEVEVRTTALADGGPGAGARATAPDAAGHGRPPSRPRPRPSWATPGWASPRWWRRSSRGAARPSCVVGACPTVGASRSGRWSRSCAAWRRSPRAMIPRSAQARLAQVLGDDDVARRMGALASLSNEAFPLAESFWAVGRMLDILGSRGTGRRGHR